MDKSKKNNTEIGLMITALVVLGVFLVFMILNPKKTIGGIGGFFQGMIGTLGPLFLLLAFGSLIVSLILMFSKYGKVRLGDSKPEYSTFSWMAMMMLASLAAAALYWSLTEWAFYYETPGIGIKPRTDEALESSLSFQFYNWGMVNQALYALAGVAIGYSVYVRKVRSFQTSAVCNAMIGKRLGDNGKTILGKVIDFCVILGILGALSSSLGLAVPLASGGLKVLFGMEATPIVQIGIIVVIAAVYIFTSYLGTNKGMKVLSNAAAVLCVAFLIYVLCVGPTQFIFKNTVNSLGKCFHNLIPIALFTDPIRKTGFPEGWTIYFVAFYLNYVAMMGIFIAKISKGRTIREVAAATVIGMSVCTWIFFGIDGSFSMHAFITGKVDVVSLANSGAGQSAIYSILDILPFGGTLIPLVMLLLIVGFVAPSMDSAALALSETVTKSGEPKMRVRLFWCVALAVIPLAVTITGSGFDAIKQVAIIVSVPFIVIIAGMALGLFKWLKEDSLNGVHDRNLEIQREEMLQDRGMAATTENATE